MSTKRHSDELFEFSYNLFKIEYKIIKLLLFALTIYGLYQFATNHLGVSFGQSSSAASSPTSEVHRLDSRAPSVSSAFRFAILTLGAAP